MSNPETSLSTTDNPMPSVAVAEEAVVRGVVRSVPFRLAVTIPVSGLKLRDLRELRVGQVFPTPISAAEDVPVRAGGALLGYAELDNVDGAMAVRMTRLS
jgi:flagellar motor switch protein FliN/FliY